MTTKTEAQEPKLAHTPGPWTFHDRDRDDAKYTLITADEGKSGICRPIDSIHEYGVPYVAEMRANARLIAAAPELLEAAKSGASALRAALIQALDVGLYDSEKEWREAIDNHSALKALNAAIAKATRAEGT